MSEKFNGEYYNSLMEKAEKVGKKTHFPRWFYLVTHLRGALKWLLTFKVKGTSSALEPVYANAVASAELIPAEIKKMFVDVGKEMNLFIRFSVIGEIYGKRFAYVEKLIETCENDIEAVVSLGSGSALAELIGLANRIKAGENAFRLFLVDTSHKALQRAKIFADILGVSDYVECSASLVDSHYKLPNAKKVLVGSWGLAANYFPDKELKELIGSLSKQKNICLFSTDFEDPILANHLKYAIGWPVAKTEKDLCDFVSVKPRTYEDVRNFFADTDKFQNEIVSIARGRINILEVIRNKRD